MKEYKHLQKRRPIRAMDEAGQKSGTGFPRTD